MYQVVNVRTDARAGAVRAISFLAIHWDQFSANDALISASCESVPAVWHVPMHLYSHFPVNGLTRFSPDGTLLAVASIRFAFIARRLVTGASLSDQTKLSRLHLMSSHGCGGSSQIILASF